MTSVLNSSAGASHDRPNRSHLTPYSGGNLLRPASAHILSQELATSDKALKSTYRMALPCPAAPPGTVRRRMGRHGHLDVYENPAGICEYPVPRQATAARRLPSVTTLHRAGSRAAGLCGPQKPLFWLNRDLRSSEATLRPPVCAVPFEGQSTPKGSSRRRRLSQLAASRRARPAA